jgi:hypothetical protein
MAVVVSSNRTAIVWMVFTALLISEHGVAAYKAHTILMKDVTIKVELESAVRENNTLREIVNRTLPTNESDLHDTGSNKNKSTKATDLTKLPPHSPLGIIIEGENLNKKK